MNVLQERIIKEGRVLPGDIIKVDGFLNHRVDVLLMRELAREFKAHFGDKKITAVLTAATSGIPIGTVTAEEFGVPLLFAKKNETRNIDGGVITAEAYSFTEGKMRTLRVAAEWLRPDDKILIVDDFMANGEAIRALTEIVEKAGAELVGIGIGIEKGFQGGGDRLRAKGIDVYSVAIVEKAEPGNILFRS